MVTTGALLHGDAARHLDFDPAVHPVALQLGGSDPAKIAAAARIGAVFGYDEINLNIGCPSDRVQAGRFGACLMREPQLVAQLWSTAQAAAPDIEVTIKTRIGVDDQDPREALFALVDVARRLRSDPELALRAAAARFRASAEESSGPA
jgi:tRNA-dihydrouridine synthase A